MADRVSAGIELAFDPATERRIRHLWLTLGWPYCRPGCGLAVLPARLVDAALPISGSLVATDLVRHTTSTATYHPLLRHPAAPPVRMDLGD